MNLKKLLTVATLFVTSALGFNANAQKSSLTEDKGWKLISELPSNVTDYFFAIYDHSNDLGMVLKDGVNQKYKTMWYTANVNPEENKDALWQFNDKDEFRVITCANRNNVFLQTEWNAGWYYHTSDNGAGNADWGTVEPKYSIENEAWTIGNHQNGNFIGPWSEEIKDGAEVAGNKNGASTGYFDIFAIERSKYMANVTTVATKENPVDVSFMISHPMFMKRTGSYGNQQFSKGAVESWNNNNMEFSQSMTELPNGLYKVTVDIISGPSRPLNAYLYANGVKSEKVSAIASEGNYGTMANEVAGKTVVADNVVVTDGNLTIGIKDPEGWIVFDNFKLWYYGDYGEDFPAYSLVDGKMEKTVAEAQIAAKNTFEANKTTANYSALLEAIANAQASVDAYASAKAYFDSVEPILAGTNVYTEEAYNQYFATPLDEYEAGTLETAEASSFIKHSTGHRSDKTVDEILLSAWTIDGAQAHKFETPLYINTWSTEGVTDGSEFLAPFFEYYTGDGNVLGATDIQAKVTGLEPNAVYSFTIRARVRATNGKEKIANAITMKVGEGEAVDISSGAKFKDTPFYIGNFTAVGETDAEGTLTATITVAEGCNVSWLSFYDANYTEGEDLSAYKADYDFALETANQLLEDAAYVNVTGVERDELSSVVDEYTEVEEDKESYIAAKDALEAAANAFATAKASYDEFVSIKNLAANYEELAYASAEKKNALDNACNVGDPDDAEMASTWAAEITTALRAYVESNGMAEGVDGAVDKTSLIANASNPTNNEGWTIEGNMNNPLSGEPWTDSNGNSSFSYFDGGNWGANSWTTTMKQTITVPAGKYLLTAVGRASNGVTLTMSVGSPIAGHAENSVNLPNVGNQGNVFGRGWNDGSLEFETPCNAAEEEITITVTATTGTQQQWFSVGNFRLVSLDPAENANMTITGAGWATFIAPFDVEIPEGVKAYTVEGVKDDNYLNKTALENVIPANTPVLLEGEAMTATFYGQNTATQDTYGDALVGNVSGAVQSVPQGAYVLQKNGDKLGFFYVNDNAATISNNRCYLNVPAGGEIKAFFFDDDATGISGIADDATVVERYNAAGMKVAAPVKGLNIVKMSNGKVQKILVK